MYIHVGTEKKGTGLHIIAFFFKKQCWENRSQAKSWRTTHRLSICIFINLGWAQKREFECDILTGRLRLKMQKIHRVNLVRLNSLKSREIIERHWICPRRNRPGHHKKKYGDAFENDIRAARRLDEDSLKIHSPAVESILSRWIDSTWFSSFIERPWIDSTDKIQRIQSKAPTETLCIQLTVKV